MTARREKQQIAYNDALDIIEDDGREIEALKITIRKQAAEIERLKAERVEYVNALSGCKNDKVRLNSEIERLTKIREEL